MGNVIGFKGTEAQRFNSWKTLLAVKEHIRLSKAGGAAFNPCLELEENWLRDELASFTASDNKVEVTAAA